MAALPISRTTWPSFTTIIVGFSISATISSMASFPSRPTQTSRRGLYDGLPSDKPSPMYSSSIRHQMCLSLPEGKANFRHMPSLAYSLAIAGPASLKKRKSVALALRERPLWNACVTLGRSLNRRKKSPALFTRSLEPCWYGAKVSCKFVNIGKFGLCLSLSNASYLLSLRT